jgi:hypothetical protein
MRQKALRQIERCDMCVVRHERRKQHRDGGVLLSVTGAASGGVMPEEYSPMLQSTVPPMLKSTVLGLGVVGALSLASSLTSASARYGHCTEEPTAADCRTSNMPGLPLATVPGAQPAVSNAVVHAHNHHHMVPPNS